MDSRFLRNIVQGFERDGRFGDGPDRHIQKFATGNEDVLRFDAAGDQGFVQGGAGSSLRPYSPDVILGYEVLLEKNVYD